MTFLNPTYFLAFLGLAVPLAIHLWNMKAGKTVKVGSIRLLTESDPKKSSSLRFNELLLLMLRMLMLSVLVLILAEPYLTQKSKNAPFTYLVEPSLLAHEEVQAILDTIPAQVPVKLLDKGFPDIEYAGLNPHFSAPNYWQLLAEIENLPADSLVVFTSAFFSGIKGKRPRIHKNINWILLDPAKTTRELVHATAKEDMVEMIWARSDHTHLKFTKENLPQSQLQLNLQNNSLIISSKDGERQVKISKADSLSIMIVKNDIFEQEVKYLRASYAAIANFIDRPVEVKVVGEEDLPDLGAYNTVFWLSELPAPKIAGNIVIFDEDHLAAELISEGASAGKFQLTSRLTSENIIEENLPEKLLFLLDLNADLQEKAETYDRRTLSLSEFEPQRSAATSEEEVAATIDISKHFWMLLLILLVVERGFSFYRKQ